MRYTPLAVVITRLFLFLSLIAGGMGWMMFQLGGQAIRDHVVALPHVDGAELLDGRVAPGTEVKLTATIGPDHEVVMPGTQMVIAERDTITTTAEQDDYRVAERDLEASHLPSLRLMALDQTALTVSAGGRVLAGSTSWEAPHAEGAWREVFRGFRNGDTVGLRGALASGDGDIPRLTRVWMIAGSVEDLDAHYNDEVASTEALGRQMLKAAMGFGVAWLVVVLIRMAAGAVRGRT